MLLILHIEMYKIIVKTSFLYYNKYKINNTHMNTNNLRITESVQNLLQKYDTYFAFPLNKKAAFLREEKPWVFTFYTDVKKELETITLPSITFEEKRKRKAQVKADLDFFSEKIRRVYAFHHNCDKRLVPRWMRREKNQSFIKFFEIFFQELKTTDQQILAIASQVIQKGIVFFEEDFENYKNNEQESILSRDNYKKLCLLKRSLQAIQGFLTE